MRAWKCADRADKIKSIDENEEAKEKKFENAINNKKLLIRKAKALRSCVRNGVALFSFKKR